MNEDTPNNADSLLEELKNLNKTLKSELNSEKEVNSTINSPVSSIPVIFDPPKLTEDNLSAFILDNAQKIILNGLQTIESLKDIIANTADAKSMSGFADIVSATTGAIATLNDINLEKNKSKTAKEIKQMDIDGRKMIADTKKPNNTLNIIAPREQIIAMLQDISEKIPEKTVIEGEATEIKSNNYK